MTDFNNIISILNLAGLGGVGAFLYYLFKGLSDRINSLTQLATEQNNTLEAVRGRADEFDKLSQSYKKALGDFQEMGEKLEDKRQELIQELEDANNRKNVELVRLKTLELQEIELKEKSLNRLPLLEQNLDIAIKELKKQLTIVYPNIQIGLLEAQNKFNFYNMPQINNDFYDNRYLMSYPIFNPRGSKNMAFINWLMSNKIMDSLQEEQAKESDEDDKE